MTTRVNPYFSPGHQGEEIRVTAYSGFRLNERPVHFEYRGQEFIVKKILDSSVREFTTGPKRRHCFTVLCETGEKFALFFDPRENRWFLS